MFTGIIRGRGEVLEIKEVPEGKVLKIKTELAAEHFWRGNSMAVDGVCLTVESYVDGIFSVTAVPETLGKTLVGHYTEGQIVNLEPPLTLQTPLAGHFVSGHVDGLVEVLQAGEDFRLKCPAVFKKFLAPKGSVTLNGVSLTLAEVNDEFFRIALIPETLGKTNLGLVKAGSLINMEVDLLARYLEQLHS